MSVKKSLQERETFTIEKIAGKYTLLHRVSDDFGRRTKYMFKCNTDSYEWVATLESIDRGSGCPECAGQRRYTLEEVNKRIADVSGGDFTWDIPEYTNSKSRVMLKCNVDGYEWETSVDKIVNNNTGCPKCSGVGRYTPDSITAAINDVSNGRYTWSYDSFNGNKTRINAICTTCGGRWTTDFNTLRGQRTGCPTCAGYGFSPNKPCDFYVNVGRISDTHFVKFGVTRQKGDRRLKTQLNRMDTCTEYRQVWREHFDTGEQAKYAEEYFKSFGCDTVNQECMPDGYTETMTNIHPCQIALHLVFGSHRKISKNK